MRIVWVAGPQQHPDLGLLDTGREVEAPDAVAAIWIEQGAAAPASRPDAAAEEN